MTPEAIREGARRLAEARQAARTLDDLPSDCRPDTLADGYAMQKAFIGLWGQPVAGWKVGATAKPVQAMFKIPHPFFGPIFAPDVHLSPASPKAVGQQHLMIESEFVLRFARGLGPREKPYSREEIIAAVDAVLPAFEIISPRFPGLPTDNVAAAIADCGVNGGEVLGAPVKDWTAKELGEQAVVLSVNGRVVMEGSGANVLGNPVNVLEWLVNDMSRQGLALKAGQFVSTGTTTGVTALEVGERAVADFGRFGKVEMAFA